MQVWTYGKYYDIDDSVDFGNFINEKRLEWEKEQLFNAIKKENERLKSELIEKEHQLDTVQAIMEEGKELASKLAIEGLKKASLQKGFKVKWNKR